MKLRHGGALLGLILPNLGSATQAAGQAISQNLHIGYAALMLLLVLLLFVGSAFAIKRLLSTNSRSDASIQYICSLPVGVKEKVILIQAGSKQLLLGVTAQ